jgi:hypothetical protein
MIRDDADDADDDAMIFYGEVIALFATYVGRRKRKPKTESARGPPHHMPSMRS